MAQAVFDVAQFIGLGNHCPGCGGKVDIVEIRDKLVHIDCTRCTWEDLFLALYGEDPSEVPWAYEEIPVAHPF